MNEKECPICWEEFVDNLGLQCWPDCLGKQLERRHRNIAKKMVKHFFPNQRIKLNFPLGVEDGGDWGWSTELNPFISVPWYTLRSKEEFFDTIPHEVAHITAFTGFFDLANRKILKKFEKLKEKSSNKQIEKFSLKHQELIDRYKKFIQEAKICCHWYNPWWLKYEKHFKELLASCYVNYAYGYTKPRPSKNQKVFIV